MDLNAVERLITEARSPRELFGEDLEGTLHRLRVACHPDRNLTERVRATRLFTRLGELADEARRPPATVQSPKRRYELLRLLGVGDVSDVHLATAGESGKDYVLKLSRVPEGAGALERERECLTELLTGAGDSTYRHYLPTLAESFPIRDRFQKQVNVYLYVPGVYTLQAVRKRHQELPSVHLAWIWNRLLSILGFVHQSGWVHGALTPEHVLVLPGNHGLMLVGWIHAVRVGQPVLSASARYLDWYPPEAKKKEPATAGFDLYMAARLMTYLAGGDPVTGAIPASVPIKFAGFLRSCMLEGPQMRPTDAWQLADESKALWRKLHGAPKFHELRMY